MGPGVTINGVGVGEGVVVTEDPPPPQAKMVTIVKKMANDSSFLVLEGGFNRDAFRGPKRDAADHSQTVPEPCSQY